MLGHDVSTLDNAFQVIGRCDGFGVYHPKSSIESVYCWFGDPQQHDEAVISLNPCFRECFRKSEEVGRTYFLPGGV